MFAQGPNNRLIGVALVRRLFDPYFTLPHRFLEHLCFFGFGMGFYGDLGHVETVFMLRLGLTFEYQGALCAL